MEALDVRKLAETFVDSFGNPNEAAREAVRFHKSQVEECDQHVKAAVAVWNSTPKREAAHGQLSDLKAGEYHHEEPPTLAENSLDALLDQFSALARDLGAALDEGEYLIGEAEEEQEMARLTLGLGV